VKIVILIDALGWELLKDRQFLNDILVHRRGVRSVYGFSAGAIPSILTGLYPQEHKHWGLFYYSPENSPFRWTRGFAPFSDKSFPGRVWRHLVEKISRRRARYSGYFETYLVPMQLLPFFDICENKDIYKPDGVRAGNTIFDWISNRGIPWRTYTYREMNDSQIIEAAHKDIDEGSSKVLFLYLCEFDAFLHRHRHDESAITNKLAEYEEAVRSLYEHANGKDTESKLLVCSDHGMTTVHQEHDLVSRVDSLGLRVPQDMIPMYDSTMARFWFKTMRAREQVVQVLSETSYGHILTEDELRGYGVFFEDGRYGELIYAVDGGCVIAPSYMGRSAPQGMHGYLPEDPGMTASLLTDFPVKRELKDIACFRGVMEDMLED